MLRSHLEPGQRIREYSPSAYGAMGAARGVARRLSQIGTSSRHDLEQAVTKFEAVAHEFSDGDVRRSPGRAGPPRRRGHSPGGPACSAS
eukprot:123679-Prymnesium_polylepis.1